MLFSAAATPQGGYYCTIVNCQTKSIAPTQVLHLILVQDTPTGQDDDLLEGEEEIFAKLNALLAILY